MRPIDSDSVKLQRQAVNKDSDNEDTDVDSASMNNSQMVEAAGANEDNKKLGNTDYVLMLLFGVNSNACQKSLAEYLNEKVNTLNIQKEKIQDEMQNTTDNITVDNAKWSNNELSQNQTELSLLNNELNSDVMNQLNGLSKAIKASQKMGQDAANRLLDKMDILSFKGR